jgi:hypothetical protein
MFEQKLIDAEAIDVASLKGDEGRGKAEADAALSRREGAAADPRGRGTVHVRGQPGVDVVYPAGLPGFPDGSSR